MFLYQPRPPGKPGSISNACSVRPLSSTSLAFLAAGNAAALRGQRGVIRLRAAFRRTSAFSIGERLK